MFHACSIKKARQKRAGYREFSKFCEVEEVILGTKKQEYKSCPRPRPSIYDNTTNIFYCQTIKTGKVRGGVGIRMQSSEMQRHTVEKRYPVLTHDWIPAFAAKTGFWFLVSGFWFLVSGFWFLISGFWILVSGFWILVSGFWFLSSSSSGSTGGPCDAARVSGPSGQL